MYKPTKEFMIVKEVTQSSDSGIVLPDKQKDYVDDQLFEVVGLPNGYDEALKVGDRVVIVGYLTHFKHAGAKITLAKHKDVVMVITEEK